MRQAPNTNNSRNTFTSTLPGASATLMVCDLALVATASSEFIYTSKWYVREKHIIINGDIHCDMRKYIILMGDSKVKKRREGN